MNLPFCVVTCTGGFGMTVAVGLLSCFFCEIGGFCTGVDSGNVCFSSLRSKGSASIGCGGLISRRWMICKPWAGLDLSITVKHLPGGRRISSSCWKEECPRIDFPLLVSIENIVRGPEVPT